MNSLNDLFSQRVETEQGRTKMAELGGNYVRDKLREEAFSRKIIEPETVTRADPNMNVSVNHDTLAYVVEVEPNSRAMVMTFRGQPEANFISAPRAEVPFITISSEKFEKTEQELQVYLMPITKIIEKNTVKDMQAIEDREFTIHIEAAVQALQAEANGVTTAPALNATALQGGSPPVEYKVRKGELARVATADNATALPVQRPDIVNLVKLLNGTEVRANVILINEVDFDDILQWTVEDNGDKVQSETTVGGYRASTLLGYKYIRTIKGRILRPGNIYAFTEKDFLGKFLILNNTKFYVDKIANLITWQSWEDIAMSIVNINSVAKLETYSGDATVNDTDSILTSVTPVDENDVSTVNNRVAEGLHYPQVETF
jgi:hypothetical protein